MKSGRRTAGVGRRLRDRTGGGGPGGRGGGGGPDGVRPPPGPPLAVPLAAAALLFPAPASLPGALASAALPGASSLTAQGLRAEARAGGHFLELRPLVQDSLPEDQVPGEGLRRRLADGTVVSCVPGQFCRWFRSGEVEAISVLNQELRLVGWTTLPGLSFHTHLRGRFGSDDFWPRSGQKLEAVTAYANYDQGDFRVRAGRQFRTDGLGYRNFDGGAFLWRGFSPLRVELFGGWSLGRGLNAPRTGDLLAEADEFAPDDRAFLLGAEVSGYWGRALSASAVYQREIRTDLLALYTERVSFDVSALAGPLSLSASADYDVALDEFNEARLRISSSVGAGVHLTAEARHYTPFFELWTIWGAFSPVGFNEGRAAVTWSVPGTGIALEAGGAYRAYREAAGGAEFVPLKDDGWRAFGSARWGGGGWFADGGYRAEVGFGAVRLGGDARVGRAFGRDRHLSLRGTSTQTISEFRLGEQRVSGGALEGAWSLLGFSVTGGAGLYRIDFENRPQDPDWTQARVHFGISYRFGTEPGGGGGGR